MQGCSELIWDLWMKSSEWLPSIVILRKFKAHYGWVSSLFPRRGHFADQDWCKKGNQSGKNRNMKSAWAVAGVTEPSFVFCLDVGRKAFFFQLLRKCTKQSHKNLHPGGNWVGDVHFNHPASKPGPLPCRSRSWWPISKCSFWWLLKGLAKKLQTSSQALERHLGNRRKLFAFLYVMLYMSPADSFQFVEETYTASQMVFFNRSS